MTTRAVELAIEIASRAQTAGMDATVAAAKEMRDQVQAAASDAATGLDRISGAADNLDDKAGRATGALGALSSGFELVGLQQYADGLNAVAMATDFASGVGQALNLVMELESLQRAKAAATAIAHSAATTAQATAAKAAAIAQGALNAVLAANPIALVVIAVVALVAAFVLAYKRSETFRDIVQAAMRVITFQIRLVIAVVSELVGWVVDRAGPAWSTLKDAVSLALATIREKFAPILDVARDVFDSIRTTIGDAIDAAQAKIAWLKEQAVTLFTAMMAPVLAIKDAIVDLVEKIASIKFPKLPDLNPFNGRASTTAGDLPTTTAAPITLQVNVNAPPLTDPTAIAAALLTAINDYLVRLGRQVVIV